MSYKTGLMLCLLWVMVSIPAWSGEVRTETIAPRPVRLVVRGAEKPIELQKLDIRGEVLGHLTRTTVEMTFYNPNGRVLEGELQFPLMDGQSVTGFALEMENGKLRAAVPVEKVRGREIFEDVIRQRVDPALLEVSQGDNFKMRVYPLNPGGTRRVSVTIVERLAEEIGAPDSWGARPVALHYRLPLAYGEKVGEFSLSLRLPGDVGAPVVKNDPLGALSIVREKGGTLVVAKTEEATLRGTLELSVPLGSDERTYVGRQDGKTYFYTEILTGIAPMMTSDRVYPKNLTVLWDASASGRGRDHAKELAFLDTFFGEVKNVAVTLQRVRDTAEPTAVFQVKDGDWGDLRKALSSTIYDGATSLGAFETGGTADMFFLFSDGLDNYSVRRMEPPQRPLFAFVSAPGSDTARLRGLSEKSGGILIDLTVHDPKSAMAGVMKAPVRIVSARGRGVADVVYAPSSFSGSTLAIAGVMNDPTQSLEITVEGLDGKKATAAVPNFGDGTESDLVPSIWAAMKVADLESDYDLNKGEIRRLGTAFGMATRETSLIVLDRVEDYVRYNIDPPSELKKEYDRLRSEMGAQDTRERNKLARVVAEWQERETWWKRNFPKDTPKPRKEEPKVRAMEDARAGGVASETRRMRAYADAGSMVMAEAPAPPPSELAQDAAANRSESAGGTSDAAIVLRPWTPDAPYIRRMKEAKDEDLYRIYLDERPDYENSIAFYLDVTAQLEERGQKELALRVLSNLAEMNLENRQVLRVLGYRLLQADRPRQAVLIFKNVLELGEEEPQSYRDLGLAYDAAGEPQKAIDALYAVVEKSFSRNFPGIEVIALTELNAIVAANPGLNTRRVDPRLLANRPLDLRVVLTWDSDNTDIDLHVIDPNGEEAFYGHPLSYQGGRVSPDNTEGYGPEEFSLKDAKPGTYRVEVNFYGHRQQTISEATTIQLDFYTSWGTKKQREQSVTMRLKDAKDRIVVGEFVVK